MASLKPPKASPAKTIETGRPGRGYSRLRPSKTEYGTWEERGTVERGNADGTRNETEGQIHYV